MLCSSLSTMPPCNCVQLPALAEALGAETASSQLLPLYLQLLRCERMPGLIAVHAAAPVRSRQPCPTLQPLHVPLIVCRDNEPEVRTAATSKLSAFARLIPVPDVTSQVSREVLAWVAGLLTCAWCSPLHSDCAAHTASLRCCRCNACRCAAAATCEGDRWGL